MSLMAAAVSASTIKVTARVEPVTRYVRIEYAVPADAPDPVLVECQYHLQGESDWRPAAVKRYRSIVAESAAHGTMAQELSTGQVSEPLAAGRTRTLIWQDDFQLPPGKTYDTIIRVQLLDSKHSPIAQGTTDLRVDMSDVVALKESMLYDRSRLQPSGGPAGWVWNKPQAGDPAQGTLDVNEGKCPLEPLAFGPDLKGRYAILVSVPEKPSSAIELRLGSDMFYQNFAGDDAHEYLWRIVRMDGRTLLAKQPWNTIDTPQKIGDSSRARLRQLRFVPVDDATYERLTRLDHLKRDKLVYAYFEPYSWAFEELVDRNSLLLEPIAAFAQAKVDAVDMQLGRFGAKPYYQSLVEQPLTGVTIGDAAPGSNKHPETSNVGRLAIYTDLFPAAAAAGRAMDTPVIANFGAGISYPHTPLEGNFSKDHPQWTARGGAFIQYKFKPVRDYCLAMYKEILDRGARRISIDFGRYPYVIDKPQTATLFLSELRELTGRYMKDGKRVQITVRFPVPQASDGSDVFDPRQWVEQGLVDVIAPTAISGDAAFFDPTPYIKMTRGTPVKCLPSIDPDGPLRPEGILQWAKHDYDLGADGVYIYQADYLLVGSMQGSNMVGHRDLIARLGSRQAVDETVRAYEREQVNFGTDIYIEYPSNYNNNRPRVWIEGGNVEAVQYFMNGKPVEGRDQPPYSIGGYGWRNDFHASDGKPVTFEVRAKIDGKWLVRQHAFVIH